MASLAKFKEKAGSFLDRNMCSLVLPFSLTAGYAFRSAIEGRVDYEVLLAVSVISEYLGSRIDLIRYKK